MIRTLCIPGLSFRAPSDTSGLEYLHAYEIYNMELEAELTVLSACNTGSGKMVRGEGIMSLSRAFLYAGCPNVVFSLWQADDLATKEIMSAFYKQMSEQTGKDKALRNAKLEFLKNASQEQGHPFHWATFVLVGNDEPVSLDNSLSGQWLLGIALLLGSGLFFFFRKRKQKASSFG